MHMWEVMVAPAGTDGGFGPIVVAVCRQCGLIKSEEVSRHSGAEDRVDLSGDCAEVPPE
jgi:hypothetical protein